MNTTFDEKLFGVPAHWTGGGIGAGNANRAAEARHGARYITEQLNSGWSNDRKDAEVLRDIQQKDDPEAVSQYWAYALSPSGGTGSGRDSTASAAKRMADGDVFAGPVYKRPLFTLAQAQAMFDWPIYRAATRQAETIGEIGLPYTVAGSVAQAIGQAAVDRGNVTRAEVRDYMLDEAGPEGFDDARLWDVLGPLVDKVEEAVLMSQHAGDDPRHLGDRRVDVCPTCNQS